MELHGKIQKWIDSIIADELEIVARESKELEKWNLDTKLNRLLFRALLCLSHTADRAKPSEIRKGRRISDITNSLCCSLLEIPDLAKYYAGLYHIIRKLIAMRLYSEAAQVTARSFPGNLVKDLTSQHLDMYPKIAHLWHQAAMEMIDSSSISFTKSDRTLQALVLELLNNELKVLEVIAEKRSAFVLSGTLRYLLKLESLAESQSCRNAVKTFFDRIDVFLIGEEKYDVYYDALRFVKVAISPLVTSSSLGNAQAVFMNRCEIVEKIFARDDELRSCFILYKNMGTMLLKPVDNCKKLRHWDLEKIRKETLNAIYKFREGKAVSANMKMIGHVLQPLSECWERCVINRGEKFLNGAVLRDVLGLIKLMFYTLNSIASNSCEVCRENDCRMKKNTHTVTVVSIRYLVILSKITATNLLQEIFTLVRELLEENVAAIFEMKESDCAQWSVLWTNCGINIYNLGVACHKAFYEETVFLFSLLCSCVVKFEGINAAKSWINIKNPLSCVLHRLSSVHFNHGNYREALTPCALNGLFSYQNPDSKAFRMWASIKHACPDSNSILKLTMVSCLKEDMNAISEIGVEVNLEDFDLEELCLHELRGLYQSRTNLSLAMRSALDELQILTSEGLKYAQGVQLLGYHLLQHGHDEHFPTYLKRASRKLKEDRVKSDSHVFVAASIFFYFFIADLHKTKDQTKLEMERSKFALRATKSVAHEGQPKNNDVVPAYTGINVAAESKLFANLQQALDKWSLCFQKNLIGTVEEWHLALTLRTLVIVAEYSRLHKFSTLEIKAWELSYELASQLKDSRTCVYVVGRSMSLRKVNSDWINTGNELTTELKASSGPAADDAVALFWVGLSNFYFKIGKHEEAAEILQRVFALPNINSHKNISTYLSSLDTILRNYHFCSNDDRGTKYMVYMARCLYSMLALMEYAPNPKIGDKEKQLHSSEVLFTCTSHLSLQMNSLLSFREITAHLTNRLKLSQASGVTLRVAECLKNLCFIDLSRMQLDDCVVKLQGLEFILQTENIEESRNAKNPETSTNEANKPGARDPRVNDCSPILRRKVFKHPEFISHNKCSCYQCSSVDYQYLVLSSTHIRAQLFFLQGHLNEALEHFNGAFYLRRMMLMSEMHQGVGRKTDEENAAKPRFFNALCHTVEFVLLLIDFSRFVRELHVTEDDNQDGINIATEAVKVCERFHLNGHPIYVSAKELLLEYQFCKTFRDGDFQKFTVPDASDIDVSEFTHPASNIDSSAVATPACKPSVKKPKTIRRNKTPPLLKLTKVSMNLSDDEDEERIESPKSSRHRTNASRINRMPQSMKRRNLEQYLNSAPDPCGVDNASRLKIPGEEIFPEEKTRLNKLCETLLPKMIKNASVFPNLPEELSGILSDKGSNESEKIKRAIELIQQIKSTTEPPLQGRRCKTKNSNRISSNVESRLPNGERDDFVNKLVDSFKEILIASEDLTSFGSTDDEASSRIPPNVSTNRSTSSLKAEKRNPPSIHDTKELDAFCVDNNSRKRLDFSEFQESTASNEIEKVSVLPKPEYVQHKEQLRTSDRLKRSRSQSIEKAKSSVRPGVKIPQDGSEAVSVSRNGKTDKETKAEERKPRNQRTIKKLEPQTSGTLSTSVEIIENSQLENSDLVPTSDLEEKAMLEERNGNGVPRKYRTRTFSRIARSRSQTAASLKLKNSDDSEREELAETVKNKNNELNRKPRASTRAKKSQQNSTPRSPEPKVDKNIPESTVSKESGAAAKKLANKQQSTSRSKLKR